MKNINEIVAAYIAAKEAEKVAKTEKEKLAQLIYDHASKAGNAFQTDNYSVIIKVTVSNRLDTAALYKDFPDAKDVYGKPSESRSIIAEAIKAKAAG